MSQLNMFTRMKIASKEQNLEYKCVLQESYKTMRRWQRPILLVEGGHCVGDWDWHRQHFAISLVWIKPLFDNTLPEYEFSDVLGQKKR